MGYPRVIDEGTASTIRFMLLSLRPCSVAWLLGFKKHTVMNVLHGQWPNVEKEIAEQLKTRKFGPLRHGHTSRHNKNGMSREYRIWAGMITRCTNPRNHTWKYYGARGISVCPQWHSFEKFFADMGNCPPGLSINRINNDGNYEPGNCNWATGEEQASNKRDPVRVCRRSPLTGRFISD